MRPRASLATQTCCVVRHSASVLALAGRLDSPATASTAMRKTRSRRIYAASLPVTFTLCRDRASKLPAGRGNHAAMGLRHMREPLSRAGLAAGAVRHLRRRASVGPAVGPAMDDAHRAGGGGAPERATP